MTMKSYPRLLDLSTRIQTQIQIWGHQHPEGDHNMIASYGSNNPFFDIPNPQRAIHYPKTQYSVRSIQQLLISRLHRHRNGLVILTPIHNLKSSTRTSKTIKATIATSPSQPLISTSTAISIDQIHAAQPSQPCPVSQPRDRGVEGVRTAVL